MNQRVILPYTPKRTTPLDVAQLHAALAQHHPQVRLQTFSEQILPIWLAEDFPEQTITVTLNNTPRLPLFDYIPGPKFFAPPLSKVQLLKRLIETGVRVPYSVPFHPDLTPSEDDFGPYITIKTTVPYTSRAAGIYVFKTQDFDRLRPKLVKRYQADMARGHIPVLQQYVLTGPKPCHTRVSTFLEAPIVCFEVTAPAPFDPALISGIVGGEATSNYSGDRTRQLRHDEEFVEMSVKIAQAFRETAVLGIDLVRCVDTGKAYCLEANLGNLAVLSAPICHTLRQNLGVPELHRQFDSYRTMARRMAETLDELCTG